MGRVPAGHGSGATTPGRNGRSTTSGTRPGARREGDASEPGPKRTCGSWLGVHGRPGRPCTPSHEPQVLLGPGSDASPSRRAPGRVPEVVERPFRPGVVAPDP